MRHLRDAARALAATLAATLLSGCTAFTLPTAPNLYADPKGDPSAFERIPQQLRSPEVTVVYATDRDPADHDGRPGYGIGRSEQVALGTCVVRMEGKSGTWEEVVAASTIAGKGDDVRLSMVSFEEVERFRAVEARLMSNAPIPLPESPELAQSRRDFVEQVHALLKPRLDAAPQKEIFLFVHGYNNTFEEAALRAAQIWHFVGREGVPVLWSWPAGSPGLLRGYTHDRESSEFTVPHLKAFLLALASCPGLEKINIVAHSRGTDVVFSALRELHLEARGAGRDTRQVLRLGNVVLAAPDIDLEVFLQRMRSDYVGFIPERFTIYVSPNDSAIGISAWLFGSVRRLGQADARWLPPDLQAGLRAHPVLSVVDVRASTIGMGHDYFLTNPAVLSDLILVLRDHRGPGAENGRPLEPQPSGFWRLNNGYPFRPPEKVRSGDIGAPQFPPPPDEAGESGPT